mmetsp:Transcript_2486/g.6738  ORF Transcript_2486/g.6738 Transcript_2486/m.6738 type:complete len:233 (-) Transcript_2486:101-799(-)
MRNEMLRLRLLAKCTLRRKVVVSGDYVRIACYHGLCDALFVLLRRGLHWKFTQLRTLRRGGLFGVNTKMHRALVLTRVNLAKRISFQVRLQILTKWCSVARDLASLRAVPNRNVLVLADDHATSARIDFSHSHALLVLPAIDLALWMRGEIFVNIASHRSGVASYLAALDAIPNRDVLIQPRLAGPFRGFHVLLRFSTSRRFSGVLIRGYRNGAPSRVPHRSARMRQVFLWC